uniref:Putative metalloproteinase n=1 Tax=Tityus obscurus TaxID=1221240 RepID=A0A1E1WVX6_TITOB
MIYLASIIFFQAVSAIPSGRTDIVFPSLETSRSGVKMIKFATLGQDIELKLKPAGEILAKDFAIVDINNQKEHLTNLEDLKRKIYRDSAKGAALLIDEDGPLTMKGIINSNLRIQPYESGRVIKDGKVAHQIVEIINDKRSYINDVIPLDVNREMENVVRIAGKKKCIVIDYLCVTESTFTQRFATTEMLMEYITVLYTGVQNLLDTLNLQITARLIGITAFKKADEPSFIDDSAIPSHPLVLDPENLVRNMAKHYCKITTGWPKEADIIMLITNRKLGELRDDGTIAYNTAGISLAGGVCKQCSKVGLAQDDTDYNERVDTVAHETAHLIGAPHDGEGPFLSGSPGAKTCPESDGYIMGGNDNKANKSKFSKCTKKCVEYLFSLPSASCVFVDC